MSLEVMKQVAQVEESSRERKVAAEAKARETVAAAERNGLALFSEMRAKAAAAGKEMLQQAEKQAGQKTAEIAADAAHENDLLRRAAKQRLNDAADYIVGKVVSP